MCHTAARLLSGGLFDNEEADTVENAFKYAVYRVSHDRDLLTNTKLKYDIQRLPARNAFDASKKSKFRIDFTYELSPWEKLIFAYAKSKPQNRAFATVGSTLLLLPRPLTIFCAVQPSF